MNNHTDLMATSLGRLLGATEFAGLYTKDMPKEVMWDKLQKLAALSKEISKQLDDIISAELQKETKNYE